MAKVIDLHLTEDRFNPVINATVQAAWEATIKDSFGNLHHSVPVAQPYLSKKQAMLSAEEIAKAYDFE